MTRTDPTRDALRAIREKYAPEGVRGFYYSPPEPLVVVPPSLHPKGARGKRLAEAHASYLDALALLEKSDDALDAAEADFRSRDEWRERRDEMADRLARGEVQPDAVEALLPSFSEADHLARCETLAVAVGAARRNVAARVREYDEAVYEIAPDMLPDAVATADRLDAEAAPAEAAASAARAKAASARAVTYDLRLPEAYRAVRAAGITGNSRGYSPRDRARFLRTSALISPLEGWSRDRDRYAGHPQFADAAKHLGVSFAPVAQAPATPARSDVPRTQRPHPADGNTRVWNTP